MIEIIITLIVFTVFGYALTTLFGYIWIGLLAAFIVTVAFTIGAFILHGSFLIGASVIRGSCIAATADRDQKPIKASHHEPRYCTHKEEPQFTSDERYELMRLREQTLYQQPVNPTVIQIAVTPDGVESRRV